MKRSTITVKSHWGRLNAWWSKKVRITALVGVLGVIGLLATMALQSCSSSKAGPYGGDVVPLNNGQAKAEVVANADSGEVMVHTWDQGLKNNRPVESRPLVLGSGNQRLDLVSLLLPRPP